VSPQTPKTSPALEDYLELFEALAGAGIEFVVIGGCAVAAYARLLGETVFSNDLDLFVTQRALEAVVSDSGAIGLRVEKMPSPRSVPVAVLDWKGREINLLTATQGLPSPDVEARTAREFRIGDASATTILIADPFDLLRNKLAVNRPKDQPHIEVLRKFIEEEAVHGFTHENEPRARIAGPERLLEVLAAETLPASLAARLVPLARLPADFRFLAHRLPTEDLIHLLLSRTTSDDVRSTVARIAGRRGFTVG
jgi:hypothetical protein